MKIEYMEEEFAEGEGRNQCAESEEGRDQGDIDKNQSKCDGRGSGSATVGGYNKDKPPEDDCCPICFDEFRFPCRTSCGHWFCSNCIWELWRYSTSVKPCKCPMCNCVVAKLVLDSSVLSQTGVEVGKIIKNIERYNRLAGGGWAGLFQKTLELPMLVRRRSREYLSPLMLRNIYNVARLIGVNFHGNIYHHKKFVAAIAGHAL
ncbi:uncharacterized protein LOC127242460 isoform X2 [Andrographis paniculata]|uniref:uncharacterized protein LOC127242460 isoform X2 n=1 Tax=Andrographis paniculata TaxID=175694 RepID=UPI0021E89A27|nr:uncharacterized protein LOC127242460 isoform X2 [Andrographis paniculata]